MKWAIDPGLEGDVYADKPFLYGNAGSSINILRIGEKNDKGVEELEKVQMDESGLEEGADGEGMECR